jgi:hypothetical protein
MSANPQSRQTARLFLRSSALGPPNPLTRRRMCPLPLWFRGEGLTRWGERGAGGVSIRTRGQTLWYSRYCILLCTLWANPNPNAELGKV